MTDNLARGEALLRQVLGEEYWMKRQASNSDFNQPLRELSASFAFGQIWTREGLEPKTRSLLCLAMLTALNRPHELDMHLKGAINNGCSVTEIQETLLQTAVYCGFPAAVSAYRQAEAFLIKQGHIPPAGQPTALPEASPAKSPAGDRDGRRLGASRGQGRRTPR